MKIYIVKCLTEDGIEENNGYYIKKENAEKQKADLDKCLMNIKYGIKQRIVEVETND